MNAATSEPLLVNCYWLKERNWLSLGGESNILHRGHEGLNTHVQTAR